MITNFDKKKWQKKLKMEDIEKNKDIYLKEVYIVSLR